MRLALAVVQLALRDYGRLGEDKREAPFREGYRQSATAFFHSDLDGDGELFELWCGVLGLEPETVRANLDSLVETQRSIGLRGCTGRPRPRRDGLVKVA